MKVLNLTYDDYANYMHGQTMALRAAGVDCTEAKLKAHSFRYAEEAPVINAGALASMIRSADIVQIFHSSKHIGNLVTATGIKRKYTVWHTGSGYRSNPDGMRSFFTKHVGVVKEFTDQCEFLIIDPSLEYIAAAVDVLAIRSGRQWETKEKFTVAHYPSKAEIKGTQAIRDLMRPHMGNCNFITSEEPVQHAHQLDRMNQCDVYVELFQPELEGRPYGCFGITAFEAAALGKVVITQNINQSAYENAYGPCPFAIANTESDFHEVMNRVLSYTPDQMREHQHETIARMIRNHSLLLAGKKLSDLLQNL